MKEYKYSEGESPLVRTNLPLTGLTSERGNQRYKPHFAEILAGLNVNKMYTWIPLHFWKQRPAERS
jgi:hypothetical protein